MTSPSVPPIPFSGPYFLFSTQNFYIVCQWNNKTIVTAIITICTMTRQHSSNSATMPHLSVVSDGLYELSSSSSRCCICFLLLLAKSLSFRPCTVETSNEYALSQSGPPPPPFCKKTLAAFLSPTSPYLRPDAPWGLEQRIKCLS